MPKVSVLYTSENLIDLFNREKEVIERITPFCNRTDREIEILYSLSASNIWKLEIKTISNERGK